MSTSKINPDEIGRFRGKWIIALCGILLVAVLGGGIAFWRQQSKRPVPAPQVVQAPPPEPVLSELSLTGKVQAQNVVNVRAQVEGTIESVEVEVGQDVFEGQLLARIRNPRLDTAFDLATEALDKAQARIADLEAQIVAARLEASRARADAARAKSEFDRAEKAWQRQKLLFSEGATPRLVYEKAERDYALLKDETQSKDAVASQSEDRIEMLNKEVDAQKRTLAEKSEALEQAKAGRAASDLHSPVDGVVIARRGNAGEQVSPQIEDLFRIATALSAMEVVLEPAPTQIKQVKAGQVALIRIAEVPGEPIQGTVREIVGSQVIVDFTSPTPLIKPGVSAQVTIRLT